MKFIDIGKMKRIRSAENRASTPPSLFGIDRKMAYTHKKYHSGLIWIGVTRGLAIKKFSGSVRRFGVNKMSVMNAEMLIEYPNMSFVE